MVFTYTSDFVLRVRLKASGSIAKFAHYFSVRANYCRDAVWNICANIPDQGSTTTLAVIIHWGDEKINTLTF
jgi:hypothetical protein